METKSLTKEQEARIAEINANFDAKVAEINKRRQYRMQNYYDCVDDYSYGGLCDKADNELEDRYRVERDILIEEVKNGGKREISSSFYRLKNQKGEVRCSGGSSGVYGQYFTADGKIIGLPKRITTLEKKGYILEKVSRVYRGKFKMITNRGNIVYKELELVSEDVERVTQDTMPTIVPQQPYVDWQYESYFLTSH